MIKTKIITVIIIVWLIFATISLVRYFSPQLLFVICSSARERATNPNQTVEIKPLRFEEMRRSCTIPNCGCWTRKSDKKSDDFTIVSYDAITRSVKINLSHRQEEKKKMMTDQTNEGTSSRGNDQSHMLPCSSNSFTNINKRKLDDTSLVEPGKKMKLDGADEAETSC